MSNQSGGMSTDQQPAVERIEEARQLYRNINQTLNTVLELIEGGDFNEVALLPKQMAQLTSAIAESQKRETEFNGKYGDGLGDGDIDFEQLRRDIGCRLGRIRKCCRS
ncbi:MAG: hypothetical protein ACSHWY_13705 [Octadecabacter sp.]